MERWGEARLMALMPAEEAEVQKIQTIFLFVCLFEVWFHYIYHYS